MKKKKEISAIASSVPSILPLARAAYDRSLLSYSEASVCIVLSVMAIEGFFNELVCWSDGGNKYLTEKEKMLGIVLEEAEKSKLSLMVKLQQINFVLTGKVFDKSSLFYFDFKLLIEIRNAIVHRKPEPIPDRNIDNPIIPHKLVQKVLDRKIIETDKEPLMRAIWSYYIINPWVARWSYNNALNVIMFILDKLPDGHVKARVERNYKNIRKIKNLPKD